jgi:flagellar biosynthetic protein FlhB
MAEKPDKDQKTEKPTPRRKKEARQSGQIAKTPELSGWALVIAATFLIPMLFGRVYDAMQDTASRIQNVADDPTPAKAAETMGNALMGMGMALLPFLIVMAVLALVIMLAQVGFIFTAKPLKPKAERLNPLAGIKKLFSTKSLWETGKAMIKLVIIGVVAVPMVAGIAQDLVGGQQFTLGTILPYLSEQIVSLIRMIAFIALGLGFADYAYQKKTTSKMMMMTKQEMKQEMKNSEGDPMVKGKIRALQRAASRNRMMAALGDANVVIMNPTHYAVALRYRPEEGAPRVVAKGSDGLALRIRDMAEKKEVPVVEAPPLARALFAACELDQEIPVELFNAVAKVLAFVQRLNGRSSLAGVHVVPGVAVA